jgi:hypothetical protein
MEHIKLSRLRDGDLLNELVEHIVDNVLKIGEKPINCISQRRFIETVILPDKIILEFSGNRTRTADIPIIAVREATEGI